MDNCTKMKKVDVTKRGPRGPLYSMCTPVEDIAEFRPVIMGMMNYMLKHKLEGLSANECGYNKQVFVTNIRGDYIRVYINPTLMIADYDMHLVEETCASYDKSTKRHRHAHVVMDAFNLKGERFVMDTGSPTFARVGTRISARLQHEMEHMLGLDVRIDPDEAAGQTSLGELLQPIDRAELPAFLLDDYIAARFLGDF